MVDQTLNKYFIIIVIIIMIIIIIIISTIERWQLVKNYTELMLDGGKRWVEKGEDSNKPVTLYDQNNVTSVLYTTQQLVI